MRFLRFKELNAKGVTYTREHLLRLEKAGQFPKRVRLGPKKGIVHWLEQEIDAHLNAKLQGRDQ
jgi:prophage regulatory protein